MSQPSDQIVEVQPALGWSILYKHEDWWAVWIGCLLLAASWFAMWRALPEDYKTNIAEEKKANTKYELFHPVQIGEMPLLARPGLDSKQDVWIDNPIQSFHISSVPKVTNGRYLILGSCWAVLVLGACWAVAREGIANQGVSFFVRYFALAALAFIAFVLASQKTLLYYNLEYVLWAVMIGLIISNTIGTPAWLKPACQTELFIKTGLVLYGADVLFHLLLKLGPAGMFISWISTPVVFLVTYWIGQRWLKIESKTLNLTICADMSVCGVSAAIATAAACRAKRSELTMAVGISLIFTAVSMIAMPAVIKYFNMPEPLAGIWLGGTIDATGAVAAAGKLVGDQALVYATTIKMIQNILIGVLSFAVAIYASRYLPTEQDGRTPTTSQQTSLWEIWRRFPKFVLGFLLASGVFTLLSTNLEHGDVLTKSAGSGVKVLREWAFCLGFVSIGLETNLREFWPYLRSGKPLWLYVIGQTLNLLMILFMGWLALYVLFPEAQNVK
jgi:uncharacterized integral membrane protein (TIGR00698 family)